MAADISKIQNAIPVINNFGLQAAQLLDARGSVDTIETRDYLLSQGLVAEGQLTYVEANQTLYVLKDVDGILTWVAVEDTTSAIQSITTGTENGTIAVDGTDVAVKGLGALAYESSLSKADVGLGNVANYGIDSTVSSGSGNYISSGAVKTYADAQDETTLSSAKSYADSQIAAAVAGITSFEYQVVTALPETGTKGVIYLIAHTHDDTNVSSSASESYDEYIWIGSSYEKIGNTDMDLSNYVPTSRTIATLSLGADISAASLRTALNVADGATANAGTVTSITAGTGLSGGTITTSGTISLSSASSSVLGGVKLGSDTVQTVSANAVTSTASRTYAVQANSSGQTVVNVPWSNTTYSAGTGLTLSNNAFSVNTGYTTSSDARNYKVDADTSGNLYVNVPWADTVYAYSLTGSVTASSKSNSTSESTSESNSTFIGTEGTTTVSAASSFNFENWTASYDETTSTITLSMSPKYAPTVNHTHTFTPSGTVSTTTTTSTTTSTTTTTTLSSTLSLTSSSVSI